MHLFNLITSLGRFISLTYRLYLSVKNVDKVSKKIYQLFAIIHQILDTFMLIFIYLFSLIPEFNPKTINNVQN